MSKRVGVDEKARFARGVFLATLRAVARVEGWCAEHPSVAGWTVHGDPKPSRALETEFAKQLIRIAKEGR